MTIFVEIPAKVVELLDNSNPYWYRVTDLSGNEHVVSVVQISMQNAFDEAHAVRGDDGSLILRHTRYSFEGVRDLSDYLLSLLRGLGELPLSYPAQEWQQLRAEREAFEQEKQAWEEAHTQKNEEEPGC